jgi:GNAT superfamily N-acetyltransferase
MDEPTIECEQITADNVDLAIKIQNEIFPSENGALNLICSIDKKMKAEIIGKHWRERANDYICRVGDVPVGITGIYVYTEYPEDGWCGWYGILPEFQGQGYGKKLLLWTMGRAKEMGLKNFRLYTDLKDSETAVNLYREIGMIEEPYTAEKLSLDNTTIFSKSLVSDKTERWNNKFLFLKQQEDLQEKAKFLKY